MTLFRLSLGLNKIYLLLTLVILNLIIYNSCKNHKCILRYFDNHPITRILPVEKLINLISVTDVFHFAIFFLFLELFPRISDPDMCFETGRIRIRSEYQDKKPFQNHT